MLRYGKIILITLCILILYACITRNYLELDRTKTKRRKDVIERYNRIANGYYYTKYILY